MEVILSSDNPFLTEDIEIGEFVWVVVVMSANVVLDIKENIKNLIGGRMPHYEKLIDKAIEQATEKLKEKLKKKGYDGIIYLKMSNPVVVEGGVEMVLYGNAFKFRKEKRFS